LNLLDISTTAALIGFGAITVNIFLGWTIWTKIKLPFPKQIPILKLHKLTAYLALGFILIHILSIPLLAESKFRWQDLLLPLWTTRQPWQYTLGAVSFYLFVTVIISSYFKKKMKYQTWKKLHYLSYFAVPTLLVHSLLTDPTLNDKPIDFLDAEKVFIEIGGCILLILLVYRFLLKSSAKT